MIGRGAHHALGPGLASLAIGLIAPSGCTAVRQDLGGDDDVGAGDAASIDGGVSAARIAAGRRTTMVIDPDGTVWAFGDAHHGQLAILAGADVCTLPAGSGACITTPTRVAALTGAIDVGLGDVHGCALRAGRVLCFGLDLFGTLGTGTVNDDPVAAPHDVGIDDAVAIGVGDHATCAVHADGSVSCWGLALAGMFGIGDAALDTCTVAAGWPARFELPTLPATVPCALTPRRLTGITDADGVAVGRAHVCVHRRGGSVVCAGSRERGAIADPSTSGGRASFEPVIDGASVYAGSAHTCSIVGGALTCWGDDTLGQIGVLPAPSLCGGTGCATTPTAVPGLSTDIEALALGASHTCVVVAGAAQCFGNADGSAAGMRNETCMGGPCRTVDADPVVATGVAPSIAAGTDHTCAMATDGAVLCWGAGTAGELGGGVIASSATPIRTVLR